MNHYLTGVIITLVGGNQISDHYQLYEGGIFIQSRRIYVSVVSCLILLGAVNVHGVDIIEDFRSVSSNLNIAAEGQTSSLGLIKHENSTYAWGGWNNAPADSTNAQLRYVSSREVRYRGDASLTGSYLISRFDVTCKLGIIEFNKTRSSRKVSFLVRDTATQNWYISDILEQEVTEAEAKRAVELAQQVRTRVRTALTQLGLDLP